MEKLVEILKTVSCPQNVIEHSIKVHELALKIAKNVNISVDVELIAQGAIYHDIGRSISHSINHAVEGVKIAKKLGLDEGIINIIERHIGSALTKEDAKSLGLPIKDYLPLTPEEKIVSYADNLTIETKEVDFNTAVNRFKRKLGADNPAVARLIDMHKEIEAWRQNA
ncbi:HD-like protein [Candidatus Magnetoovum chiemensis]|nr:HD-like protein [Candidatus Magnetoovum chiemensis]